MHHEYITNEYRNCGSSQVGGPGGVYRVSTHVMLCEIYSFTNAEAADVLGITLAVVKHRLHDARSAFDRIFEHRCALINKHGVCHQCSQLNGFFNPQQKEHEELAKLDLVQATRDGRQHLLDLRLQLARGIDPLHSAGSDIQEAIMSVCRAAVGKESG